MTGARCALLSRMGSADRRQRFGSLRRGEGGGGNLGGWADAEVWDERLPAEKNSSGGVLSDGAVEGFHRPRTEPAGRVI